MAPATLRPLDPSTSTPGTHTYPDVPGIPDKYNFRERLPQSFPHGLLPYSLEPGAMEQQYPPSSLFPEPPFGDGPELRLEPPLQALTQVQDATRNLTKVVGELAASMWRKATTRERHFPQQQFDDLPEVVPTLSVEERRRVHSTPVYLTNTSKVFDVEGFVPKESIIDTRASKAMCSLHFATAIGIEVPSLQEGDKYITASGNVEKPLGVTHRKLKFTLGRDTTNTASVELQVIVVDTTAYDMILGMDFIRAFN